jgi:hypothetical protein
MGLKYIFSPLNITLNITHITAMASAWIKHVAVFRKAHPGMDPKKVFGEAAKTFKKQGTKQSTKQSGGLSALNPEAVDPGMSSSGTEIQIVATKYSGGAKRSAKRGGSKRSAKRGGSKRSAKRGGSKRGGSKRSARRGKRSAKGGSLHGDCGGMSCYN